MQLDQALRQIADIRQQMARSEVFRGYRSITVGLTGAMGVAAAILQPVLVPAPHAELGWYLALWISVAALSLVIAGIEIGWRAWRAGPGMARQHTLLAVQQFLPSIAVGGLVTLCIARSAPHVAWMLPGLWSLLFGLGLFASLRLLPRPVLWVASFYILCGCAWLLWGHGERAFAPWQMGISFGGGQLLGAAILFWTLERSDGTTASQ